VIAGTLGAAVTPAAPAGMAVAAPAGMAVAEPASASAAALRIATGKYHSCAILTGGSVRCWGYGGDGALGYGDTSIVGDNETPTGSRSAARRSSAASSRSPKRSVSTPPPTLEAPPGSQRHRLQVADLSLHRPEKVTRGFLHATDSL